MKIKKVIISNFRAYREQKIIDIDDLTVFVGKNDVGKSTILEALDIFFNDGKGVVKIEAEDLNKHAEKDGEKEISISVVFSDYPEQIDLDAGNKTSFENEFLLNSDKNLEIKKIYKNARCSDIFLVAYHPTSELASELLLKKQKDLKKIVDDNNFTCINKVKNAELRKAIWENSGDLKLNTVDIPINEKDTDAKAIWENLQKYLPVYALFQSDRSNNDNDSEVQDPLKLAVQEILKNEDIQKKLQDVAKQVEEISKKIADSTLEKLNELNPEIAKQLRPNIPDSSELKWADVFKKISISSDNDIPLNKRGSGVRRLVLISFFGSQAERRRKEKNVANIIYAIEEPETSQHPDHQRFLIDSLVKLSRTGNTQILLTTHHPATAQLLPIESLRLIKNDKQSNLIIQGGENVFLETADTLGVLPNVGKLFICVEGETDRDFLMAIGQIKELKDIIDINCRQISIVPMNGSNLKSWINRNYLESSNIIEFHLYDKDADEKYKSAIELVNNRKDLSYGVLTTKLEIENYIHKDILLTCEKFKELDLSEIKNWDNDDIPLFLTQKTGLQENDIKSIICGSLASKMTKELFENLNSWNEIEGWFKKIKEILNSTIKTE